MSPYGADLRQDQDALVVALLPGLAHRCGAAGHGSVEGGPGVVHQPGQVVHAVAVGPYVGRDGRVGGQRGRDDEADVALLEHVARLVAHPGLGTGVGGAGEAEGRQ